MQKISVISPIYNAEKTIVYFLECLLNQQYTKDDYEIILVDDCSTDTTCELIKPFLSKYTNISLTRLEKNSGPSRARNTWAALATYDILAFIDADAYADSNRLQNIHNAFEHDKVLACGGMIDNYNSDFFSNINHIAEFSQFYSSKKQVFRTIASANLIYRKDIFNKIWGFNEGLRISEDVDLNFRFNQLWHHLMYYPNIIIRHDTSSNIYQWMKKLYGFWLGSFVHKKKYLKPDFDFIFNKALFIIARPTYLCWSIYAHFKRRSFRKHLRKSIGGLPRIIYLRILFRIGVFQYIFIRQYKDTNTHEKYKK